MEKIDINSRKIKHKTNKKNVAKYGIEIDKKYDRYIR